MTTALNPTIHADLMLPDLTALKRYARRGDPRAFECLVHRYQQMVFATCLRTLRDRSDAEDAAQETFVKLARHAGTITSNVAAWLHACAQHTAVDMVRSGASRRAATLGAAQAASAMSADSPETAATFREIESHLDAALERLDEGDRSLIVQRFLTGRSQADMARDARVPRGTMHRRIDRALERLRAEMPAMGVAGVSAGQLAAGMESAAIATTAGPELTSSLTKIGLSGTRAATHSAGLWITGAPLFVGALVALLVGIGMFLGGHGGPAAAGSAVPRPKKPLPRYNLIGDDLAFPGDGRMTTDGVTMRFEIPSNEWGWIAKLEFRVERADPQRAPQALSMRLQRCELPPPGSGGAVSDELLELQKLVGQSVELESDRQADLLTLRIPALDISWRGVLRPGTSESIAGSPAESLAGEWQGLSDWSLEISKDNLTIYQGGSYMVFRYRVLEWTETDGHTRIQAISADSVDPSLVGKRVKMLLRRSGDEFVLAMHERGSPELNTWPSGFEREQGDDLRVMTWRKGDK